MKVIVVSRKDTNNFVLAHIVKSMLQRGHQVDIYGLYMENNHMYMFHNLLRNEEQSNSLLHIFDAEILTKERMESYDIAFVPYCFFLDMPQMIDVAIYTFSVDTAYIDEPFVGTDLLFERGSGWRPVLKAGRRPECSYVVVGEPKHDNWNIADIVEHENRLLFIDSGHYPFGLEGKTKVAEFILQVCREFPQYELVVKPRFLKGDTNVTHKNEILIYDIIEQIAGDRLPENLMLLQEHKDLAQLIAGSHTVICMYTTAYIDAAVQGKGLIILDGLPNEDNAELRIETHWNIAREIMESSGTLVDYREAIKYLPDGIKCNEEHMRRHIYSKGNISGKIVQMIEYMWESYISKGHFPKKDEYFYDTISKCMKCDDIIDMSHLIELRKKNYLYFQERRFYKGTTYFPEDERIVEYIESLQRNGELKTKTIEELHRMVNKQLLEYCNQVPRDEISQSYLFAMMLSCGDVKKIYRFAVEDVACKKFYYYILARAYYDDERYEDAKDALEKFFSIEQTNSDMKSFADMDNYRLSANFYCGMCYMELQEYDKAYGYFMKCQELTGGNHGKAKEQIERIRKEGICDESGSICSN